MINDNSPFGVYKKMICHTDRINEYIQTGDTFPIVCEINLTDICNLKCSYCFCDHRGNSTLNTEVVMKFIKDFKTMGGKAITFSGGGEPTLHKHFNDIIKYTHDVGLQIGLITNGAFSEDRIDTIGTLVKWVRISLDSVDSELYKTVKGADKLGVVLRNIQSLSKYSCKLGINCNVTDNMTSTDVAEVINTLISDVDYIQFRPTLPRFTHNEDININSDVWDMLAKYNNPKIIVSYDKMLELTNKSDSFDFPFKSCEGHFFSPILDSTGELKVCMYHPNDCNFTFGNINTDTLFDIWNSKQRQDTIQYVRDFEYVGKCQLCCKLFEINKFIEFVKFPNTELDVNFL